MKNILKIKVAIIVSYFYLFIVLQINFDADISNFFFTNIKILSFLKEKKRIINIHNITLNMILIFRIISEELRLHLSNNIEAKRIDLRKSKSYVFRAMAI